MAEECLSLVKGQNSWKEEARKEKAAPCRPCPNRSLPGEDTLVAQNLEMEALIHSLYAVYPKGT